MKNKYFYVILASFLYGCMPLIVKQILKFNVSAQMVVNLRFLFAALFLYLYFLICGKTIQLKRKQYIYVFIFGVGGFGLTGLLLTLSYQYLSSGLATVFHFTAPLFVHILLYLFFKEKLSLKKIISILVAVLGLVCIFHSVDQISLKGVLLASSSGFFYAVYMVAVQKSDMRHIDSFVLVFYITLFSGILFSIVTVLQNEFIFPDSIQSYILILIVALFCTLLPMSLITLSVQKIGSQKTSIINMLEPLISVVLGVILLNEKINIMSFGGIILVIMAIIFTIYEK